MLRKLFWSAPKAHSDAASTDHGGPPATPVSTAPAVPGEWSGLGRAPKRPDGTAKQRSPVRIPVPPVPAARAGRLPGTSAVESLPSAHWSRGEIQFHPSVSNPLPSAEVQQPLPTRRQTLGALLAEELSQEEAARLGQQARRDALAQLLHAALPNGANHEAAEGAGGQKATCQRGRSMERDPQWSSQTDARGAKEVVRGTGAQ